MNTGVIISGTGHGLLILWMLFGGFFDQPDEAEFTATDVSILSEEEFLALTAPARAPSIATEAPEALPTPAERLAALPPPTPAERPEVSSEPAPVVPPAPEVQPDVSDLAPVPEAEARDDLPDLPMPPATEESTNLVPDIGTARPVARVAPTPSPAPPPEAEVAPVISEAPKPSEEATEAQPEETATAPEEAAPEIVTEAEVTQEQGAAPASSIRPTARPARIARREEAPEPTPAPPTPPAPQDAARDDVADAVAQALSGAGTAPSGPPLTSGEKDAFRLAVSRCWNVGSLSTEALKITVVVGVEMTPDGKPRNETIRLLSHSGGSDGAARQTYESARRAIIRCGATGFKLPKDKFSRWRDIEMTFNPEKMRIR